MRRRDFIGLVVGAAAVRPPAVWAQPEQTRRLGILVYGVENDKEIIARLAAFRTTLKELGWDSEAKLRVDTRFADNGDELREKAKELVALAPDVILAMTPPSVIALQKVSRKVPIVFAGVTDPVGLGIVQNLAHPGGNATGFISAEFGFGAKLLELLKEIAPGLHTAAIIADPDNAGSSGQFAAIQTVASSLNVELSLVAPKDDDSLERRIADLARSANCGIIALRLAEVISRRKSIITLAARYRLPAVYPLNIFVVDGGLLSYGPDVVEEFRQAGTYVDRIFKGERPADLPVQEPTKYQLAVNLKTAKALGVSMPASLLSRADEVIE
jgi:putative ABC transport system substrate-binding protein